jgi:hypothetical protein
MPHVAVMLPGRHIYCIQLFNYQDSREEYNNNSNEAALKEICMDTSASEIPEPRPAQQAIADFLSDLRTSPCLLFIAACLLPQVLSVFIQLTAAVLTTLFSIDCSQPR